MCEKRIERVSKQEFLEGLINVRWVQQVNKKYKNKETIAKYSFAYKRINQKYRQLCNRYKDVIDKQMIFFFCQEIISDYIEKTVTEKENRDYLIIVKKKKDNRYNDDISRINFRLDKQINNKIDEHKGVYEYKGEKVDNVTLSFNDTIHSKTKITYADIISNENSKYCNQQISDEEEEKGYKRFLDILNKAKLTAKQKEVMQVLNETDINYRHHQYYTQEQAAKILNCSKQNINKHFNKVKEKIKQYYQKNNVRQKKLKKFEMFVDNIEDEEDVIHFILSNLNTYDIEYILYEVKGVLRRHFIVNFIHQYNKDMIHNKTTRKFCRYFLKELYDYVELIRYNDNMSRVAILPVSKNIKSKKDEKINKKDYFFEQIG